ncbi:MAG TPA: hypothetical protein VFV34_04395 [Blastocatellia bacterium]|nr:hypothetical protein [Blastocatellia bacterium]
MEAEQLWKEVHHLFDTDDGSLPEIWIVNLSKQGVVAIFSCLQNACRAIANGTVFWSLEDQQERPIKSVPNAADLVVQGRAEPLHFLCQGLTYEGVVLPDIGVFVFGDQIALDYRMGKEWDAVKVNALFGILKEAKKLDSRARISIEDYAAPQMRKQFEKTWRRFSEAGNNV